MMTDSSRITRRVIAAAMVLVLAVASSVGVAGAQDPPPEPPPAEPPPTAPADAPPGEDVDHLTPEEEALLGSLQAITSQRNALEGRLQNLELQIAETEIRLAAVEARLEQAVYRSVRARAVLQVAERELVIAEERLRQQAVEAYINGGNDPMPAFAAFLTLDNPQQVASALALSGAVAEHQGSVITTAVDLRALVDQLKAEAEAEEVEVRQLRDEVQVELDGLVDQRDRPGGLVDQVEAAVKSHEGLIAGLDVKKSEFEARLKAILAAGSAIAADIQAAQRGEVYNRAWEGTLSWPVPGSRIGSGFGARVHPIYGEVRHHAGVDAAAPSGTPIYASADGRVLHAGPRGGYGNAVVILHGEGLATVYAHMSSVAVHPGKQVARGETLGFVGSTGQSTGPHLHWEVRILGEAVNPVPFIGSVTPLVAGLTEIEGPSLDWAIEESNDHHRALVKVVDDTGAIAAYTLDAANATEEIADLEVAGGVLRLVLTFVDKDATTDGRSRLEVGGGEFRTGNDVREIQPRTLGVTDPDGG